MKETFIVILKAFGFALATFVIINFSYFDFTCLEFREVNKNLEDFTKNTGFLILGIIFPTLVTSFIALNVYILQRQSSILNNEDKEFSEQEETMFGYYDKLREALIRIIRVLLWALFMYTVSTLFPLKNLYLIYACYLIQLTIIYISFYGLYQMAVNANDILQPH